MIKKTFKNKKQQEDKSCPWKGSWSLTHVLKPGGIQCLGPSPEPMILCQGLA